MTKDNMKLTWSHHKQQQTIGGRKENWVYPHYVLTVPDSYGKWSVGSGGLLEMIAMQPPGAGLPVEPLYYIAFGLCYRKALLALLKVRQVGKLNNRMPSDFFKNRRVYLLTGVAYMGSLLFGTRPVLV